MDYQLKKLLKISWIQSDKKNYYYFFDFYYLFLKTLMKCGFKMKSLNIYKLFFLYLKKKYKVDSYIILYYNFFLIRPDLVILKKRIGSVVYSLGMRLNKKKKQISLAITWLVRILRKKTGVLNFYDLSENFIKTLEYKSKAMLEKLKCYKIAADNLPFYFFLKKKR